MIRIPNEKAVNIAELDQVVEELCHPDSLDAVWHRPKRGAGMPSLEELNEIMAGLRTAIFPGYYGRNIKRESMRYQLSANLDSIYHKLSEQILRGFCFGCDGGRAISAKPCDNESAQEISLSFMQKLPTIRSLLAKDAQAAYEGDPAATSSGEAIFCYPSLHVMLHHRVAHELYKLHVPVIPRIISEMAHSKTGIDIHPGAQIGEYFFIDHGTGVVIGETSIIGKNCRIYQGVTLGALSFPKNPDGTLTKNQPRHPILEDNVTVYAGATILGRITIGKNAVIGGNVWITKDVKEGAKVSQ